jgi:hypothetical protein
MNETIIEYAIMKIIDAMDVARVDSGMKLKPKTPADAMKPAAIKRVERKKNPKPPVLIVFTNAPTKKAAEGHRLRFIITSQPPKTKASRYILFFSSLTGFVVFLPII